MNSLVFAVVIAVAVSSTAAVDYYDSKFDSYDFQGLINDDAKLQTFVDCLLSKGTCSEFAQFFKENVGEAIVNACQRCSDVQKPNVKLVIDALEKKFPTEFGLLKKGADPENKLYPAFYATISKV